jgi:hypothetical protein
VLKTNIIAKTITLTNNCMEIPLFTSWRLFYAVLSKESRFAAIIFNEFANQV